MAGDQMQKRTNDTLYKEISYCRNEHGKSRRRKFYNKKETIGKQYD